jgi:uncharacterized integral membrane protein
MERPATPEPLEPTPPPPEAGEPRAERARRHGKRARLYTWAIVAVVLLGVLIAWVVANRETIEVDWLVGTTDAALALVIFVAAALGWILGIVTSAAIRRRTRRPRSDRSRT